MGDAPASVRRKAALDPDPHNVFIRLYRHRPQRRVTPTENFVTEAFAIVLSLQRPILEALFQRLGEHGVPSDVRVETQVPEGDSRFDMTISNERDFYFVVECKLGAEFAKSADETPDQLSRYAAAVSRSPALRKGVITLTARTPPAHEGPDVRLLTAHWADVLSVCEAQPHGDDVASVLTRQFVDLLRFVKADRGRHPNGRLLWRCDLCGRETSGQGIRSHRDKHRREYEHLIDEENQALRNEFVRTLAPHAEAIEEVLEKSKLVGRIEMSSYRKCADLLALFEEARLPRKLWPYVANRISGGFSNRAREAFLNEVAQLVGVDALAEPRYSPATYENVVASLARAKGEHPVVLSGRPVEGEARGSRPAG
jgi:hypothetical protein